MKRSYRLLFFALLLAMVLVVAIAPVVLAYTDIPAHTQSGGTASLTDSKILAVDTEAVKVESSGVLTVSASWLQSNTSAALLSGTGTVTAKTGGRITLGDTKIYTYGLDPVATLQGAQGVYATGAGAVITLNKCYVESDQYAARGLYTTQGGKIVATDCTVVTNKGGGGAAVASSGDNGGTIIVNGGSFTTKAGMGSSAFYCSGSFLINNAVAYAALAEGACVDGGYSLVMDNTSLTAAGNHALSVSKGPLTMIANDAPSMIVMTGGKLWAAQNLVYAPNSKAVITLTNVDAYTGNKILVGCVKSGGPPENPARESYITLIGINQDLMGDMVTEVDATTKKPCVVDVVLKSGSFLTGTLNAANAGLVNLNLDRTSKWVVTGTSHVNALTTPGAVFPYACIHSDGYNVYYDAAASPALWGRTVPLLGGGLLLPE